MKKIGVFTSGGDAPGMNAAIRAIVRSSIYYGLQPVGIKQGYDGMIRGDFTDLGPRSVSNIIHQGGTILKSARSQAFMTGEGREMAYRNLYRHGIDGLVPIGGNGTMSGARQFYKEHRIPMVCVPGTIDNDLDGTDYTLGYDTATNRVVEAIDAIRDTASSHNRLFFIEVMGRHAGFIALRAAIAAGAEAALIPEEDMSVDALIGILEKGMQSSKSSSLVVVAEAGESGRTSPWPKRFASGSVIMNARSPCWATSSAGARPHASTGCWPADSAWPRWKACWPVRPTSWWAASPIKSVTPP